MSRHQKPIRQLNVAKCDKMEERSGQPGLQIHVSTDESTESSGQVSQDSYSENTSLTRYRRPSSVDGISNREAYDHVLQTQRYLGVATARMARDH